MRILDYPSKLSIAKTLETLISEHFQGDFKVQILELAVAGDVTVVGRKMRIGVTGLYGFEDPQEIEGDEAVIHPADLRAGDWDWNESKLTFETVSRNLPEGRDDWYVDVSFVTAEIIELIEGELPANRKPVHTSRGPRPNKNWPELLQIAKDLARDGGFPSKEDFYETISETARNNGGWAPKGTSSYKARNRAGSFGALASKATRQSE
ncbi:hypothetical protein [Maricaulis sp. MIT060901]|uniref:hypothetical protein n=1 Tax=Maricaulis sp. MIT060901 TaxID=3096993 RepID=UPI00399AA95D